MPLPIPIGKQQDVLYLPTTGHFVVLGTAGSGKTVLAVLRAAYLADPRTAHSGKTLLVTFNRTLVTYLHHLQDRRLMNVTIETYHRFALGYLNHRGLMGRFPMHAVREGVRKLSLIQAAIEELRTVSIAPVLMKSPEFFEREITYIGQKGLQTRAAYVASQPEVAQAESWTPLDTEAVFAVYELYRAKRSESGYLYDWDDVASAVCDAFANDPEGRLYRHVIVDEGQDFSPEMIRSLTKAVPKDGSITFFGDVAQQIYGRRFSWRMAGLQIKDPWLFEENFRNSPQISRLAVALSKTPSFKGTADLVEPKHAAAAGPLPVLVRALSLGAELRFAVAQAKAASRLQSVAVLVSNHELERQLGQALKGSGAVRLHRDMVSWDPGPGIRYGTFHAAKGLEFDTVVVPFLGSASFPDPVDVATQGASDALAQAARLLYVAITRAKSRLLLTYTGTVTPVMPTGSGLFEQIQI